MKNLIVRFLSRVKKLFHVEHVDSSRTYARTDFKAAPNDEPPAWSDSPQVQLGGSMYSSPDAHRKAHGPIHASEFLDQAIAEMGSREVEYDAIGGERSMTKVVPMFNLYADANITVEQGWGFMEILKMVRSQQGCFKADNYVDGAAYASLAGEQARQDRGPESCNDDQFSSKKT